MWSFYNYILRTLHSNYFAQNEMVRLLRVFQFKVLTPAKSLNQTSSSSWNPEPKPLMSTSTPYNPRAPQPKPLMPPSGSPAGPPRGPPVAPPGSGSPWTTPHGAPPYDQSPRPGGSMPQPPPWSQGRISSVSDHLLHDLIEIMRHLTDINVGY